MEATFSLLTCKENSWREPDRSPLSCGTWERAVACPLMRNTRFPSNSSSSWRTGSVWVLSAVDAARAGRALAGLAAAPTQAIPLIKEHFHLPLTRSELARCVTALDDDSFPVREQASRQLADAGADAADLLRQALADKPSPEAKRRIDDLLRRLEKEGVSERLRCLRAIEVLERIGTPQAGELLRELVGKPMSAELHEDIEATLGRMEKRQAIASERTQTP